MEIKNKLVKIVLISLLILFVIFITMLSVLFIFKIRERDVITKKYEKGFFDFFNTGEGNECIVSSDVADYYKLRGLTSMEQDISVTINDYVQYVMDIYNNVDGYYDYKTFERSGDYIEQSCFVRASLSELKYELTEDKLIDILTEKIPKKGNDKRSGWFLRRDKDFKAMLPGGIILDFKAAKLFYEKRDIKYNSFKIVSPIYDLNLFSNKKKFKDIYVEIEYMEEDGVEKKIKTYVGCYRRTQYSFHKLFGEIYNNYKGFTLDDNISLDMFCEQDVIERKKREKEMYKRLEEEEDDRYIIPDAVHNACIGNYNIGTFLDSFKEKIKKEGGLFKNYKIKDTKQIYIENKEIPGKELRELTLDDGNDTKIYCLFKIIYPGETDYINYTLEDVGDILTYIIPEDKMNLSYEEMYQLAFND